MPYIEWRGSKCRVRWDTGKINPETGKRIYDSKSGFDDEDEAYNYGLDRESDIRNDRYISRRDGSTLMRNYCAAWLKHLDVGHLRWRQVEQIIRLYIVPYWGDHTVGGIKSSHHRAWKLHLKEAPNVGERYQREIELVFSMLMDDAVDDELRSSSPVKRNSRRGQYKKKPKEKKREMRIDDVHQLALNALTFWGFPGYVYFLTMPFTSMRPGEMSALRREFSYPAWPASDPDPERREEAVERYAGEDPMPALRVQHQFQRERGKGSPKLYPPKYESTRTLVLPPFLAELHAALAASHDREWLFPAINGGPLAKANFRYHYWRPVADGRPASQPYERRRGDKCSTLQPWRQLPELPATAYAGKRLYLLRHGGKEWLDEDRHSRIAVETRMGHELAGVEGLYANVTTGMERDIMESLQLRWVKFIQREGGKLVLNSPTPLPFDLESWWKSQAEAAEATPSSRGS